MLNFGSMALVSFLICGALAGLIGAGVLYGVAVVVYAFSRSIPLTGAAMFFGGLAFQLQQTVGTAILQNVVPRTLLGRVTALLFLAQAVWGGVGLEGRVAGSLWSGLAMCL